MDDIFIIGVLDLLVIGLLFLVPAIITIAGALARQPGEPIPWLVFLWVASGVTTAFLSPIPLFLAGVEESHQMRTAEFIAWMGDGGMLLFGLILNVKLPPLPKGWTSGFVTALAATGVVVVAAMISISAGLQLEGIMTPPSTVRQLAFVSAIGVGLFLIYVVRAAHRRYGFGEWVPGREGDKQPITGGRSDEREG